MQQKASRRQIGSIVEIPDELILELIKSEGLVRRILTRIGATPAEIDDVLQEVALSSIGLEIDKKRSLQSWVIKVARNLYLNEVRARTRRTRRESRPRDRSASEHNEGIEFEEERELVVAALLDMSEAARNVLLAHYYGQLTVQDLATMMRLSSSSVHARINSALRELKGLVGLRVGMVSSCAGSDTPLGVEDRALSIFARNPSIEYWRIQSVRDTQLSQAMDLPILSQRIEAARGASLEKFLALLRNEDTQVGRSLLFFCWFQSLPVEDRTAPHSSLKKSLEELIDDHEPEVAYVALHTRTGASEENLRWRVARAEHLAKKSTVKASYVATLLRCASAQAASRLGRPVEAEKHIAIALETCKTYRFSHVELTARRMKAQGLYLSGRKREALAVLSDPVVTAIARMLRLWSALCEILIERALFAKEMRDIDLALDCMEEARGVFREEAPSSHVLVSYYHVNAQCLISTGDVQQARKMRDLALASVDQASLDKMGQDIRLFWIGHSYRTRNRSELVENLLGLFDSASRIRYLDAMGRWILISHYLRGIGRGKLRDTLLSLSTNEQLMLANYEPLVLRSIESCVARLAATVGTSGLQVKEWTQVAAKSCSYEYLRGQEEKLPLDRREAVSSLFHVVT